METPWHIERRSVVYENPWTTVWEDELRHRTSGQAGLYGHLAPVNAVVICAFNAQHQIAVVKQWRHAWQRWSWECPCGRIEPGEDPLTPQNAN